jgi:hypothetical protein
VERQQEWEKGEDSGEETETKTEKNETENGEKKFG